MMKGWETLAWLVFALLVLLIRVICGQGTFKVALSQYDENTYDRASKCVKLCVTTSPSGYPRCNLNTTQDTAFVFVRGVAPLLFGNPWPSDFAFQFQEWEDNSELSAIVWKLLPGRFDCEGTNTTNATSHGEATTIIPRLEQFKTYHIVSDNWGLAVRTKLECNNPGCLLPCVPLDNHTGHYTCHEGNKKCLPKWYGRNCLKTCVLPSDPPGNYRCSRTGEKECLPNWFGENCTTFCNRTSSTYKCEEDGSRTCFENWFDEDCSKFCDNSTSKTYTCSNTGEKVCKTNYYGENCLTFCNNNATTYNCSKTGRRICLEYWFGNDCSKFCETNAENYQCSVNGSVVCAKNQFGNNCAKFCNTSTHNYICDLDGNKTCSRNWFGKDCSKFCNISAKNYACDLNGIKICFRNWFGKDCSKFCDINSTHYRCDNKGNKFCSPGHKCASRCKEIESVIDLYLCENVEHCPYEWIERKCSIKCIQGRGKELQNAVGQCKERSNIFKLCSQRTKDKSSNCSPEKRYNRSESDVSKTMVFGSVGGVMLVIVLAVVTIYVRKTTSKSRKISVVQLKLVREFESDSIKPAQLNLSCEI